MGWRHLLCRGGKGVEEEEVEKRSWRKKEKETEEGNEGRGDEGEEERGGEASGGDKEEGKRKRGGRQGGGEEEGEKGRKDVELIGTEFLVFGNLPFLFISLFTIPDYNTHRTLSAIENMLMC